MLTDRQSNPLQGATPAARDLFDAACEGFALYRGDPLALLDAALAEAPGFVLARLMQAWALVLSTEPEATATARGILAGLRDRALDARAAAHAEALTAALDAEWGRAAARLAMHSLAHPRDLLALQVGHISDYLRADARGLRDRIARALPAWRGVPGRSWVLGMLAFGLEEAGDGHRAEMVGREALDGDARDCWAHHAVAHVFEMQGRPAEGLAWMTGREAHWACEENFLKVHNWWHRALCHIELGDPGAALALLDGPVAAGVLATHAGSAVDLVDAAALLWRLDLMGVDVGERWAAVSDAWMAHADGRLSPFNDLHGAMAHLGAGRVAEVDRLLAGMDGSGSSEASRWAARIGKPLIQGFAAFRRGDHMQAAMLLWRARPIVNAFGGSHAQRDVIDWTLTEAALRGGLKDMAAGLVEERLAQRPHSPVNLMFRSRAAMMADAA